MDKSKLMDRAKLAAKACGVKLTKSAGKGRRKYKSYDELVRDIKKKKDCPQAASLRKSVSPRKSASPRKSSASLVKVDERAVAKKAIKEKWMKLARKHGVSVTKVGSNGVRRDKSINELRKDVQAKKKSVVVVKKSTSPLKKSSVKRSSAKKSPTTITLAEAVKQRWMEIARQHGVPLTKVGSNGVRRNKSTNELRKDVLKVRERRALGTSKANAYAKKIAREGPPPCKKGKKRVGKPSKVTGIKRCV